MKSDARTTTARPEPSNKLNTAEQRAVLDLCNHPDYAHLPLSQIVPRLADDGVYLAPESTFYRVLRPMTSITGGGAHRHHAIACRRPVIP